MKKVLFDLGQNEKNRINFNKHKISFNKLISRLIPKLITFAG